MMRHTRNGCLIVFEGIDGAGKTTQCERLARRLADEGWDVVRLREPTDGPHGRRIRELARSGRDGITVEEELGLFIDDRRDNVRDNIAPALARGAVVILDRYYYSTMAYQGARGLDPRDIRRRNEAFAPLADILLYLVLPAEVSGSRIEGARGGSRDLFEKEDYLRKVKAVFDAMDDPRMRRIDATRDADAVAEDVWKAVAPVLEGRETTA